MTALTDLYASVGSALPAALSDWDDVVDGFIADYEAGFRPSEISSVNVDSAFFLFDHGCDRVVLAYAVSTVQLTKRDGTRMRGFPNVNVSVRRVLGQRLSSPTRATSWGTPAVESSTSTCFHSAAS